MVSLIINFISCKKIIRVSLKISFNRYNGRKKYLKVSAITNSDGAIFSTKIVPGKKSDCVTITETLYNIPIDLNTLKNSKN